MEDVNYRNIEDRKQRLIQQRLKLAADQFRMELFFLFLTFSFSFSLTFSFSFSLTFSFSLSLAFSFSHSHHWKLRSVGKSERREITSLQVRLLFDRVILRSSNFPTIGMSLVPAVVVDVVVGGVVASVVVVFKFCLGFFLP